MGGWGIARAVALQPDGKIVLAGFGSGFALARYKKDGTLDPTFGGGDGKVTARRGSGLAPGFVYAMAIRPDGKIVVGGNLNIFRFAVARYRPDGRLDRTFSGDGWVSTSVGGGEQSVHGLVLRPNGRVVAIGDIGPHELGDDVVPRIVVVRYTADGRLDRTFGAKGKVVTRFSGGVFARGSAKLSGGRIVVVGGAGSAPKLAVACYLR
jgi:uncharacterized delta-60 repeat protein